VVHSFVQSGFLVEQRLYAESQVVLVRRSGDRACILCVLD